ncbi:MAG: DivIVA domain-containing protein [Solirubrobacterales bacterium]
MDAHSINRIRNARFAHAVRGYDRHEVDQFLSELADWLERDGSTAAGADQVRAELARAGEQVADLLTEAHDAAQEIREEAAAEARKTLVQANATGESLRADAEGYADETREQADAYARKVRADADSGAEQTREEADAAAVESREAAEAEAERIVVEANRRKRDIEAVISDLEQRRDAVLSELERLASGITGTATQHRGEGKPAEGADQDAGDTETATASGEADRE